MPFVYGQLAGFDDFANRKNEIESLLNHFRSGVNMTLISPRRWGKSSLLQAVAERAKKTDRDMKFCFIDLFSIRNEEEFYQALAEKTIRATSSKFKEWVSAAKEFLPSAIPKVTFETPGGEFELGLNWPEISRSPADILHLPERLAKKKNIRLVICIDEFQNIATLHDPIGFQKQLRAIWQHHQHVSYCLYGSMRHMLIDVFTSPSMPFYKFGDILFLQKIEEEEWIEFIKKRFQDTGKSIDDECAALISRLVERHSYYVQQLAQQSWLRTQNNCEASMVIDAHDGLMRQMSMLFQEKTSQLSHTQINFLQAYLANVTQFSSQETIQKYRLGTSGNVNKIKQSLIKKEILEIHGDKILFLDPLYKAWLQRYFFT